MPWLALCTAVVTEIIWGLSLKWAPTTSRPLVAALIPIVLSFLNMGLLSYAMRFLRAVDRPRLHRRGRGRHALLSRPHLPAPGRLHAADPRGLHRRPPRSPAGLIPPSPQGAQNKAPFPAGNGALPSTGPGPSRATARGRKRRGRAQPKSMADPFMSSSSSSLSVKRVRRWRASISSCGSMMG